MNHSRSRMWALVLTMVMVFNTAAPPPVVAQEQDDPQDGRNRDPWLDEPAPYEPDEFPQWARDLRRGEIIAFGAFPVAMIISGIGYQLGRFAYYSIDAGRVEPEYAPGFFSPQSGPRYDSSERIGLIVSGAIISAGVAVADYLLGRREDRDTTQ
ncbi:MAG: hypothetical protein ACOCYB_01835 [Alkalispirochaeta sp.]